MTSARRPVPGRLRADGRATCGLCTYSAPHLGENGRALRIDEGWKYSKGLRWLCPLCSIGQSRAVVSGRHPRTIRDRRSGWDRLELRTFTGDRRRFIRRVTQRYDVKNRRRREAHATDRKRRR